MVEQWYKLGGKKNAAKLNSSVDVLEVKSASGRRSSHGDVSRDMGTRNFGTRPSMIEIESVSGVLRLYSEASSREATFPLTSFIPPSDVREKVA